MASTTGTKGEDTGEPDKDEQDGSVRDDEKKKKKVTRDDTFLRCGEGHHGGELTDDGDFLSSEDELCCDCSDDVDPMRVRLDRRNPHCSTRIRTVARVGKRVL